MPTKDVVVATAHAEADDVWGTRLELVGCGAALPTWAGVSQQRLPAWSIRFAPFRSRAQWAAAAAHWATLLPQTWSAPPATTSRFCLTWR